MIGTNLSDLSFEDWWKYADGSKFKGGERTAFSQCVIVYAA